MEGERPVNALRHLQVLSPFLQNVWRWIAAGVFLLLVAVVIPGPASLAHVVRAATGQQYSRVVRDRTGIVLAVLPVDSHGLRRQYVSPDSLPGDLVAALLAAEDRRFYHHPGVDPLAVLRAAAQNVVARRVVSGASTISMQVVRMFDHTSLRGAARKIRHMVLAVQLERALSKEQILAIYLSNVPMGGGAAGVESGARRHFGTDAAHLSPAEMVSLAVIPRSPAGYHPHLQRDANVRAAEYLAGRLPWDLTREDIHGALAAAERRPGGGAPGASGGAPHLLAHIARATAGESGTTIDLTIDITLQEEAAQGLRSHIPRGPRDRVTHGAVLIIDGLTGDVLAWVGSPDFHDPRAGQVDGVTIRRQAGSTLKPFLYARALDRGYTAATLLPDLPREYPVDPFGERVYVPRNYSRRHQTSVRLRTALATSLNIPAVHTLEDLGVPVFLETLRALQFTSLDEHPRDWGLGLALGNGEIRLAELVPAYTVFLNEGDYVGLRFRLEDDIRGIPGVFSPRSAAVIRHILGDDGERAPVFHRSDRPLSSFAPGEYTPQDYPSQGILDSPERIIKTGTANQFSNVWAVAATPQHIVGVWMGNVTGETVRGTPGAGAPAALAHHLLDATAARTGTTPSRFAAPPGVEAVLISPVTGAVWSHGDGPATWEYLPVEQVSTVVHREQPP